MSTNNHADFTDTTARLAILKAKAAYHCKIHPDVLILFGNSEAEKRAYVIAQNTLTFNDKTFLLEKITQAVKNELEWPVLPAGNALKIFQDQLNLSFMRFSCLVSQFRYGD